jgi:O-antigen ligase
MFSQVMFLLLMIGAFGAGKGHTEDDSGFGRMIRILSSKLPVRVVLILALLGAMVVGVLWIGGEPLTKRLETIQTEVSNEDADTGEGGRRMQIWKASWKIFKDHPFTGIGFGGYWVAITEYYDVPGQKRPYQAHNDYLEVLVSGGVIGVTLGLWFLIALLKKIRETFRTKDAFRRAACLGALTGLFGVAVHSLVDFGLHITINALIAVALIVIATMDDRVDESIEPVTPGRHRRRKTQTHSA